MKARVAVAIAIVWKGDRLLLTKRPQGAHLGGLWELPGGKIDGDETPERCAVREVFEEVGLRCRATGRRDVIEHEYDDCIVALSPVDCEWTSGGALARQVADFAWVRPDDLDDYDLPEANAPLTEALKRSPRGPC